MQDKHMQERRAMEDECQGKMKAVRERHQKKRDDLKANTGDGQGFTGDLRCRPARDKFKRQAYEQHNDKNFFQHSFCCGFSRG